jgi:hypothetical protein
MLGSATGGVDSLMEISSAAPSSSTWKLNNLKPISKPPVLAEANPVKLEMGSMVVIARELMANIGVVGDAVSTLMVGDVVSMLMADEEMSMLMADEAMLMSMADKAMSTLMAVGDVESTAAAGDEPSTLIDVDRSVMVGEGAGESVDLDPVVPTVGAN